MVSRSGDSSPGAGVGGGGGGCVGGGGATRDPTPSTVFDKVSVTSPKRPPKSACFPNEIEIHVVSINNKNKRQFVRIVFMVTADIGSLE